MRLPSPHCPGPLALLAGNVKGLAGLIACFIPGLGDSGSAAAATTNCKKKK